MTVLRLSLTKSRNPGARHSRLQLQPCSAWCPRSGQENGSARSSCPLPLLKTPGHLCMSLVLVVGLHGAFLQCVEVLGSVGLCSLRGTLFFIMSSC